MAPCTFYYYFKYAIKHVAHDLINLSDTIMLILFKNYLISTH